LRLTRRFQLSRRVNLYPVSAVSSFRCVFWPGHRIWTSCWLFERNAVRSFFYSSWYVFCAHACGAASSGRWDILWKPLCFPLAVVTRTLRVCAELHNILIERASCNVESPLEDDVDGGSGEVHLQGDCDLDETRCNRNRASEKCPLRVAMTRELKLSGMRRPA